MDNILELELSDITTEHLEKMYYMWREDPILRVKALQIKDYLESLQDNGYDYSFLEERED